MEERMSSFAVLLHELDPKTIAQRVEAVHNAARMEYCVRTMRPASFRDFEEIIGDYYNFHVSRCMVTPGWLSHSDAVSTAKAIIEQEHGPRRHNTAIIAAFNDARDGTNGGLRRILNTIAENLRNQAVNRHVRDAFDRNVAPYCWEAKVKIIRQFLDHFGRYLPSSVRTDIPERYADNYEELILAYCQAYKEFNRLVDMLSG
jgi:hypothetical protein